jgi:NAD(P)-dependent dehydrogenase (short-subunit alcohol dehydrogenase family)
MRTTIECAPRAERPERAQEVFMFENQIALITGGSTGIGAAAALHFAKHGAGVVITGRHEDTLKQTAAKHASIRYLVADAARDAGRTLDFVRATHGRLDILVNNAGVFEIGPLSDSAPDMAKRTLDVNVAAVVETTRAALALLRTSKGTIVNVASIVADQPFANMSVYSASKAAVLALTRAWAQELAPEGIRVNAVSPGPIETPIFGKLGMPADQLAQMAASIKAQVPLQRYGSPEEVANVIGFLASKAASFVTGGQYTCAGGMEA